MRSLSKPETFELFKKLDILCIGAGAIFTAAHFPVAIEACAALVMALPGGYPGGLKFTKALSYFLENYDGLTLFLEHADVAINPREYLEKLAQDLLQGQNPYTFNDFADLTKN